tara:strand:- start:620 stop:976 length:357 start_codon:yes stop_codon:yes gene_type:complete
MKKLKTSQWLLLGGAIGLAYILYSKSKSKGSDLIEDALSEVSNGGTKPMQGYETGGVKPMPSSPTTTVTQGTGIVPDKMLRCKDLVAQWRVIEAKTTWANKTAMLKARASFLGACNTK